jgi:hypothetical protein
MRMAFGLVSILVTIGVIAWLMHAIYLPDTQASLAAQKKADTFLNQLNGQDDNGVKVEDSYKVFPDSRDDGKLQDLQVTQVLAGGPIDVKFGLKPNDVIIAAIDGHLVRTDLNGLNSDQDGKDAIRDAYTGGGQLVVERNNMQVTLPLAKSAQNPIANPAVPPTALTPQQQQMTQQQQQTARQTEKQQEGKSNDGSETGTMDQINQRLH